MNAIIIFTLGDRYEKMFEVFKPSVEKYCKKYDIEFIQLKEYRPGEPFDYNWKTLVVTEEWCKKYERVAVIDADIYISENALNIFDGIPDGKIGITRESTYNDSGYYRHVIARKWDHDKKPYDIKTGEEDNCGSYSKLLGFFREHSNLVYFCNTGVAVFQPEYHADYIQDLYDKNKESITKLKPTNENGIRSVMCENWSWYNFQADGKAHIIDHRFNMVWCLYRSLHYEPYNSQEELIIPLKNFIETGYFCHFTDMEDVDVLSTVSNLYLNNPPTTLIIDYIEGNDLSWLFHKYIRAKNYEKIYIINQTPDIMKTYIYKRYPIQQSGFKVPAKYICTQTEPIVSGRVIRCRSDVSVDDIIHERITPIKF